jgi:hypothetical protein
VAHGAEVDDLGIEVEAPCELARPLIAQTRRREDEYLLCGAARVQLRDGEPGLNRFSQPDIVRQEDAGAESAHECHGRLELMRQEIHSRPERRAQGAGRRLLRDERAAGATPPPTMHESERWRLVERLDDIEGRKDTAFEAHVRRARARQRHELTVLVCADVGDAPAMTADADEITDAQHARAVRASVACVASGFRLCTKLRRTCRRTRPRTVRWRNLHHASAIRAQIAPRACARNTKTGGLPQYGG